MGISLIFCLIKIFHITFTAIAPNPFDFLSLSFSKNYFLDPLKEGGHNVGSTVHSKSHQIPSLNIFILWYPSCDRAAPNTGDRQGFSAEVSPWPFNYIEQMHSKSLTPECEFLCRYITASSEVNRTLAYSKAYSHDSDILWVSINQFEFWFPIAWWSLPG